MKTDAPNDHLRIVRMQVDNVLKLKEADVTPNPDKNLLIVGGRNAQGKTSWLRSIAMALGGTKSIPPMPVHQGSQTGKIILDLGEFAIRLSLNAEGTSNLTVKTKDGFTASSPQKILDGLKSYFSLDPMKFLREPAKKQADVLAQLAGINLAQWEADYKIAYEERRVANVAGLAVKAEMEGMPSGVAVPVFKVDVTKETDELRRCNEHNREFDRIANEKQTIESERRSISNRIGEWKSQIADLERRIAAETERDTGLAKQHADLSGLGTRSERVDTAAIEQKIAQASATNEKAQLHQLWKERDAKRAKLRKEWEACEAKVKGMENEKLELVQKAAYPIPGLLWTEDGIIFNGLPFEQASGAEKLRVVVAMAAAMNPRLRILPIEDGSLLDEESMRLLEELCDEYDMQAWIEVVGSDGEPSLVFEGGEIIAANPEDVTVNVKQPKLEVAD